MVFIHKTVTADAVRYYGKYLVGRSNGSPDRRKPFQFVTILSNLPLKPMPVVIASRSAHFLHHNDWRSEWGRTGSRDSQQLQGSVESLRRGGSLGSPESVHPQGSVESPPPAKVEHPAHYMLAAELDRQVRTNAWFLLTWFP